MASSLGPRSASSDSARTNRPQGVNNPRNAVSRTTRDASSRTRANDGSPAASSRVASSRTSQRPHLRSVRIGDIDRYERDEQARLLRSSRRKPFIILAAILVGAFALIVAFVLVSHSSLFTIENIEVEGADHLTTEEAAQLIVVPQGTTLLNVDTDSIISSLKRDAWVEDVTVSREFPSTLKVIVTERTVAAVVEVTVDATQTIQQWAISSDGMWLMAIPSEDSDVGSHLSAKIYEDRDNALLITGVPYGVVPEIGAYCTDENVNNALAIVDGMTTELADQVKKVTATDAESTMLTLESGIEIAFGTADDIRDKERVCLEIMEEYPDVVYINVRIVDRPTWRS